MVTQVAAVAGATARQVAAIEATPQLQDGRRWALGGYRSDHLRPALVSRGKAVADWAAAVPPERAMAPAVPGRRPHWPLRAAPALGWHCRPVPPAVRCSAGGPSSAGSPTCGARKPAPGWVRPPPAVPPATVASAVSMQTRPTLHQNRSSNQIRFRSKSAPAIWDRNRTRLRGTPRFRDAAGESCTATTLLPSLSATYGIMNTLQQFEMPFAVLMSDSVRSSNGSHRLLYERVLLPVLDLAPTIH